MRQRDAMRPRTAGSGAVQRCLRGCILLAIAALLCAGGSGAAVETVAAGTAAASPGAIRPYVARFGRSQPIIAVIAENSFTELTDFVIPYGLLTRAGVARVVSLSTRPGPVQMFPALRLQPQATSRQFDALYPEGADYVVVPAVHRNRDPELIRWVREQADKGGIIVGVCDGVWVLANAGLLQGRQAVGHWYSFRRLQKEFPETRWLRDTRYVADANVVTTTGVTAAIPASLALIEAIAGTQRAAELAQSIGLREWTARHRSDDFRLTASSLATVALNWLKFWSHEDIAVPIADGVDEISLALVADAYSRTYRSTVHAAASRATGVVTRSGLVVLPDSRRESPIGSRQMIALRDGTAPVAELNQALYDIGSAMGANTAALVRLQMEYPKD